MRRPSPATIIASIALFFSLAGTGLAASKYLITSTKQIKPSVLQSLRGKDGPRGLQGLTGAGGPAGPAGAAGAAGGFNPAAVTIVQGSAISDNTLAAATTDASVASCPAGSVVVGGGYVWGTSGVPTGAAVTTDGPQNATTWAVAVRNMTGSAIAVQFNAQAICAS